MLRTKTYTLLYASASYSSLNVNIDYITSPYVYIYMPQKERWSSHVRSRPYTAETILSPKCGSNYLPTTLLLLLLLFLSVSGVTLRVLYTLSLERWLPDEYSFDEKRAARRMYIVLMSPRYSRIRVYVYLTCHRGAVVSLDILSPSSIYKHTHTHITFVRHIYS